MKSNYIITHNNYNWLISIYISELYVFIPGRDKIKMKELNEKEKLLLTKLRENGEKSILQIAKENKIPKSTMFDVLKKLQENQVVDSKTLIDFEKIGFPIKIFYVIKTNMRSNPEFRVYLKEKRNINSFYRIGEGVDFLFEAIFRNFREVHEFEKEIGERFEIFEKQIFNVIENIKFENFLTKINDFEI